MYRIVTYSLDELAYDAEGISAALNQACSGRSSRYFIRGVCQVGDEVYFVLLPAVAGTPGETYILVPVDDFSEAGFTSFVAARWAAGFDAVATIRIGDSELALLARTESTGK